MSRKLRVELEASEELQTAAAWYNGKRPGLGDEFIEAIERTIAHVLEMPASFPAVLKEPLVRRALAHRFPYAVVFTVRDEDEEEIVHVLAIAHARRRPLYWLQRIEADDS